MRFKYYLRGIGIGITFATLLITVSIYFGKDYLFKEHLSNEEIIERATKLGMVMSEEDSVKEEDEISADASIADSDVPLAGDEEASVQDETAEAGQQDEDSNEPEETPKTEDSQKSESTQKANDTKDEETVTYVPFTVRGGESSEAICAHLKRAGLIDDADDFNKYLNKCKVDNRIQNGTFYIKQGSEYDDILALLVNKDNRTTTPPKN